MTPAVRLLENRKIPHKIHLYHHNPDADEFGREAADQLNLPYEQIFKTLVVSADRLYLVTALVPVSGKLDLKKLARVLAAKKACIADRKAVERSTGYVVGGVSPLAQKKKLPTVIDRFALKFDTIFVSAGQRGVQMELSPKELAALTDAVFHDIGK